MQEVHNGGFGVYQSHETSRIPSAWLRVSKKGIAFAYGERKWFTMEQIKVT
jgi:hypothetical protein